MCSSVFCVFCIGVQCRKHKRQWLYDSRIWLNLDLFLWPLQLQGQQSDSTGQLIMQFHHLETSAAAAKIPHPVRPQLTAP